MAYVIRYSLEVDYIGNGANQMSVPAQQRKLFIQTAPVLVPGADAPSAANFNTAITGGMTTDLEAQVLANLGQLQGFASGGP